MIKKSICIVVVLLLLFTGCDNNKTHLNPDKPITITIWHYYTSHLREVFERMISEFNNTRGKELGIIIQPKYQEDIDILADKIISSGEQSIGSEPLPNIIFAYTGTVLELDNLDVIVNLEDYFTDTELSQYNNAFIEEGKIGNDNKLKSFPVAKSTELIFINNVVFSRFVDEANKSGKFEKVSVDDFKTFEGIEKLANVYYEWSGGKSFFGVDATPNLISIGLRQLGNVPVKVENGKGIFNIDKDSLKVVWDFYYKNIVTGRFVEIGRYRADDMKTNDVVAYIGSSAGFKYFPDEITIDANTTEQTQLLVMPYPVFEGKKKVTIQQGAGMSVIKSDETKQLASCEFIKWFTEPKQNVRFSYETGYLPVKKSEFLKDYQEKEKFNLYLSSQSNATRVIEVLEVAAKQFDEYEIFVDKEYKGSFDFRNALGISLSYMSLVFREAFLNGISSGKSYEEVVTTCLDYKYFEKYYESTKSAFENNANK